MSTRDVLHYLLKAARISGWLLLPLMIIYLGTGFALCGMFGFGKWMDKDTALVIHRIFDWPLLVAFSMHASISVYFAMRRWGWIKKRTCP